MSRLLGLEFSGAMAHLTIVDRQAKVLARRQEVLVSPAMEWWSSHPDERVRAALGLLSEAVADGLFRPADVAAIGLSAEPALALVDADLDPIPPRDLPWGSADDANRIDPNDHRGAPWSALEALFGRDGQSMIRIGPVLNLIGFLRYRLTGSLASEVDFAWEGGHVESPGQRAQWRTSSLEPLGILPSHLPPIFPTSQRVSVVGEETITKTGLRRGTWVSAGGLPRNLRLLFAGEPTPDHPRILVEENGVGLWRATGVPEQWSADTIPTVEDEVFFRRERSATLEELSTLCEEHPTAIVDWNPGVEVDSDNIPEQTRVAADAGEPTTGTALAAGLGLGWWRDPRPLWRKRRPPIARVEWELARAEVNTTADSADEESEAS